MTATPPPYECLRQAAKALGVDWQALLTRARKIERLELNLALETSGQAVPTKEPKPDRVAELHAYWQKVTGLRWSLNPKHRQTWRIMIEEVKDFDRCKLAVDGLLLSPFHNGENSEHRKWHDPIYVRKWADKFADLASEPKSLDLVAVDIDKERAAHAQQFIDLLHHESGGLRSLTVIPKVFNKSHWHGGVTPIGTAQFLGVPIYIFKDKSMDHHAVLYASHMYAMDCLREEYGLSDLESHKCAIDEASIAVSHSSVMMMNAHEVSVKLGRAEGKPNTEVST